MKSLWDNARWATWKERLRSNYWLLPSIMLILSIGLGLGSLHIDHELSEVPWKTGWIYMGGADGARSMLSTLAGATLTLAGVIFSMNLVALTMASAQFGPRLLYNFVRDIGSQVTMGTFISVFAFCVVVLREIKGESSLVAPFVPHFSVTVAGIMSLCSLAVLIYFVHHVAVQIQAPVVVANVGLELENSIQREFDQRLDPGQERTDYRSILAEREQPDFQTDGYPVNSRHSGYIQAVDFSRLLVLATRYDLVISLPLRPGQFAIEGSVLFHTAPADNMTDKLAAEIRECVVTGKRRNASQDIEFIVNELCEVGIRAMSPAINDPFTCMSCVDWLTSAIEELFQRDFPRRFLCDDEDNLRLIWTPITHTGVMDAAFNQIRHFGQNCPAVMIKLLDAYSRIGAHTRSEPEREIVKKHADMAIRACRANFAEPNDVADADAAYNKVIANLAAGSEI